MLIFFFREINKVSFNLRKCTIGTSIISNLFKMALSSEFSHCM